MIEKHTSGALPFVKLQPLSTNELTQPRTSSRSRFSVDSQMIPSAPAQMIGVQHLLASDPEIAEGEYTGRIAGIPCFHEGKIEKLEAWLGSRGEALADFPESYFYGDSQSDVPLMEKVTNPVVVGPDEALGRIAKARRWPVISLR